MKAKVAYLDSNEVAHPSYMIPQVVEAEDAEEALEDEEASEVGVEVDRWVCSEASNQSRLKDSRFPQLETGDCRRSSSSGVVRRPPEQSRLSVY